MSTNPYATDMVDSAWEIIAPLLPAAQSGGRPRTTDIRAERDFLSAANWLSIAAVAEGVSGLGNGLSLVRTWQNAQPGVKLINLGNLHEPNAIKTAHCLLAPGLPRSPTRPTRRQQSGYA
jgi:hypothetical protein